MLHNGKAPFMCAERCGGTKMVGDGKPTETCPNHGPEYLCYSCFQFITWTWVLTEAARKELLDGGASLRDVINTNRVLMDLQAEAAAGGSEVPA